MAQIVAGNRGGYVLIHNNFRYQKNKKTLEKIHWRCWRKDCRSALHTNVYDTPAEIVILEIADHNHAPEPELVAKAQLTEQMLERVDGNPNIPARQIYDEVTVNLDQDRQDSTPSFSEVRSRINRRRSSHLPPLPTTVQDVQIRNAFKRTIDGLRFLSRKDNGWGIVVFCSDEALRCLGDCEDVYLDATFKTTPRPYRQFFTMHGRYIDRVVPLVFALMDGREVGQYRQIFAHLKRRYHRLTGNHLTPSKIITDFELALVNAAETEFPNAQARGCYFHLCKSMWRRVQNEGLTVPYINDAALKRRIRKLIAIAFLPVAVVRLNFDMYEQEAETRRLFVQYPAFRHFVQYFRRNYIEGQYDLRFWNVYSRNMDNRTNNHVESFNRRLNANVGKRHPNIWLFIHKLKQEEARGKSDIAAANRGEPGRTRRRKYRLLEERVQRVKYEYRRGIRNLDRYWRAVTYAVMEFV